MSNYKFDLRIRAKDIYDKLNPEQKQQFSDVMIINAKTGFDGDVVLECLALEGETKETPHLQILADDGCYLSVVR